MNAPAEAEVLVVGAGPAASATALHLARAGRDVLLLERARAFPRSKPCGDCMSPQAARLLERWGVLHDVVAAEPAALRGWRIVAPSGAHFEAEFPADAPRALSLDRSRLDMALLGAALAAGARCAFGSVVRDVQRDAAGRVRGVIVEDASTHARRVVRARFVVGADGLRSVVARRLGLLGRRARVRKLSLTAHVRAREAAPIGEMHLAPHACLGVAPVSARRDTLNVTLVVEHRFARAAAADPHAFMRSAMRWFPALAAGVEAAIAERPPLLGSGPFDTPMRAISVDGAALVGDAAGYFDPFTGQGVYQALATGEMLAEALEAALRSGDERSALRGYIARRAGLTEPARRLQRLIDSVLASPRRAELAVRRLARAPRMAEALIAVTGDLLPARALLSPGLLLTLLDNAPAQPSISAR